MAQSLRAPAAAAFGACAAGAGTGLALRMGQEVPRCFRAGRCAPRCWSSSGLPPLRCRRAPSEPADRGISMSAWAGAAVDRSVVAADSGRPLHDGAPLIGATALGNIRWVALGGTVDATPGTNGDGRLSIGVLLGVQPEVDRIRIQVLGEAGRHRFSDVGGNAVRAPDRPRHLVAVPRRSPRRRPHRAGARDVRGGRLAVRALRRRRGDRHERRQLSCRRIGPTTGWAAGCAGWRFGSGCASRPRTRAARKR